MSKKSITASSARDSHQKKSGTNTNKEVPDHEIDFSDIPELTKEQLSRFKPRFQKVKAR